jgi:hypothetical protein
MDLISLFIIICTFMFAIVYNHRRGYLLGIASGHITGIYETVEWLRKNKHLEASSADGSTDVSSLVIAMAIKQKLREQRISQHTPTVS